MVGVVLSYVQQPAGSLRLLTLGVLLVLTAIVLSAQAYRLRDSQRRQSSRRGLMLSALAGGLMGIFYPFVAKSLRLPQPLDAYTVSIVFALGVGACAIPLNVLLMRHPLTSGPRVPFSAYTEAPSRWHLAGLLGGCIWAIGGQANFIASQAHIIGPAVSYAVGQGATLVSAAWGVFIWDEFANAPRAAKRLLPPMFAAFLLGLAAVAAAPLYH